MHLYVEQYFHLQKFTFECLCGRQQCSLSLITGAKRDEETNSFPKINLQAFQLYDGFVKNSSTKLQLYFQCRRMPKLGLINLSSNDFPSNDK